MLYEMIAIAPAPGTCQLPKTRSHSSDAANRQAQPSESRGYPKVAPTSVNTGPPKPGALG